MADCSKTGEDEELMLELSIGGIFGKPRKPNPKASGSIEKSIKNDDRIVDLNVQSEGDVIQVLRRPELRRKREEKVRKLVDSGSCGSVSGPFVENKEWLEAQIARLNDEPERKKEKVGSVPTAPVDGGGGGKVVATVEGDNNWVFRSAACRSLRAFQGNMNLKTDEHEVDDGGRCSCKKNLNGCGSLAYSDGQSSSHRGNATDDSRSNSSNSQLADQQLASTSTTSVEPFAPSDKPNGSSKQTVSTTKLTTDSTVSKSNPAQPNDQSNPHESSVLNPPSKPEPSSQHQHQQASLLARMPCVSTTGNGPNGKTISGFLYRYTKNEVSIVCVCHGRSFSPAGFVEHAGGIDIINPLKHITIFPAAFAS